MSPKTPEIPVDPNLALDQAKAQKTLIDSLQTQAQGDTANLMARYGTRLALAGSGMTPLAGGGAEATPAPQSSGIFAGLTNPLSGRI